MDSPNAFGGVNAIQINTISLNSLVSKKTIDITGIYGQLEIYQTLFAPTMLGSITISDSSGLLQNLPMLGEESLTIDVQTPNRNKISKTFYVYGIDNLDYDENGSHINFRLNFASADQYNAITTIVAQGFNQNISSIVQGILTSKVQTKQIIEVEMSKGIETLIIPSLNCWEGIELLRKRAVSPTYNSPYVFFEDMAGYHFVTYEYLINKRKANSNNLIFTADSYLPKAGDNSGSVTVLGSQLRNASNLTIDSKASTTHLINSGGINSRTVVFDFLNKSISNVDTNYNDAATLIKQPFASSFNPSHSTAFANTGSVPPITYMLPLDTSNASALPKQYGQHKLYASMLNENKISFNTPGDTQIQAGDIINFIFPVRVNSPNVDNQATGLYIIGNIRLGISGGQAINTIEAFRFGFPTKVI